MNAEERKVMKQALDSLNFGIIEMNNRGCAKECMPLHYAAKAMREALAAPQPAPQEPTVWHEVKDLDSLEIGDCIRTSKGGVVVSEIAFYVGHHEFDLAFTISERLLVGEDEHKNTVKQMVKTSYKNEHSVCAPAKGWKIELREQQPAQQDPDALHLAAMDLAQKQADRIAELEAETARFWQLSMDELEARQALEQQLAAREPQDQEDYTPLQY